MKLLQKKFLKALHLLFALAVLTTSCQNETAAAPDKNTDTQYEETSTRTDILFMMYLDGDNSLSDALFQDLNEAEAGLYAAKASGGKTINVIALWDGGMSSAISANKKTKLLHVGPDARTTAYGLCTLSSNTRDLTSTASWITDNEADMANPETLSSFINWTLEHYTADTIILEMSDHGGGPGGTSYANQKTSSRIICSDDTSGTYMSTQDLSLALQNAGFGLQEDGTCKRLDLLTFDLCLEGSLEEAYQYRNQAELMLSSPNNIPGNGFNYATLIPTLTGSSKLTEACSTIIDQYAKTYDDKFWKTTASCMGYSWSTLTEEQKSLVNFCALYGTPTLSLYDLTKADAAASALKSFTDTVCSTKAYQTNLIKEDLVYYKGTYTLLYDTGYLMDLYMKNADETLKEACLEVQQALSAMIVKAWRDDINTIYSQADFYQNTLGATEEKNCYGITIGGFTTKRGTEIPSFYDNIDFTEATGWKEFLNTIK